jgi:hypothetical protein
MFVITAVFCKIVRIIIYQLYLNKIYDLHHIYNDHPQTFLYHDVFRTNHWPICYNCKVHKCTLTDRQISTTKPGILTVMYMWVWGFDFSSSDFLIEYWNCSDSAAFFFSQEFISLMTTLYRFLCLVSLSTICTVYNLFSCFQYRLLYILIPCTRWNQLVIFCLPLLESLN